MSKLIILEGPDGGGKTKLGQELVKRFNASYVHHGSYAGKTRNQLLKLYAESLQPALDGRQDVVLDRCWLSEPIYGAAHRGGEDRVGVAGRRMLERLAMRCETVVVLCRPPLERCVRTFLSRRGEEYLPSVAKLEAVYHGYGEVAAGNATDLPVVYVDYTAWGGVQDDLISLISFILSQTTIPHPLTTWSAGNWLAPTTIVGESYHYSRPVGVSRGGERPRGECDWGFPAPFVSATGCSPWLADRLEEQGLRERDLCWVNSDDLNFELVIRRDGQHQIIALGRSAHQRLNELGIGHVERVHPQYHKRFHHGLPYTI